jgi:poly(3-hydroxybutyrate) depolymerase
MKEQPTVLIVAPLSGHHSTLLRDTVRACCATTRSSSPTGPTPAWCRWTPARSTSTTTSTYVQEFIRHIGPEVNVISVCQPTVPVLAAISLLASNGECHAAHDDHDGRPDRRPQEPDRGEQPGDEQEPQLVRAQRHLPRAAQLPGRRPPVYPGFLQHTGFVAMNPDRHLSSHYDYFLDLVRGDGDSADSHREFYDEYNAVLDMPAEYYLDTIKTVFQDFALVNGTWHVNGQLVRPQDIKTTALLTIEGELDDISGAGQTKRSPRPVHRHPKTRQFHYDVVGAGHYGIFSGRRWREKVYPEVKQFIASHQNDAPAASRSRAAPAKKAKSRAR